MSQNLLIGFKIAMRYFVVVALSLTLGCTDSNLFEGFSNTTEDEALYYEALEGIRKADYTRAITACTGMSADYQSQTAVAELCAAAYAGRCGYKLTTMLTDISDYVTAAPPERIFEYFMIDMTSSAATQIDDCDTAESIIRGIGVAADRTDDQNIFMVLLAIKKISVIVNETADATDDGALDGGFDACNVASITATQAEQIGSAFWELDKSLDAISTNPFYTDLDTAVDTVCTALNVIGKDLCAAADPTTLGASEVLGARSLIKEGFLMGVDQCGGDANLAACNCP